MAKKSGGIGAKGSAKARFFHPGQKIRDQWPNQHQTLRLSEVLIVGKAVYRVNRRDQLCYECRLQEIENVLFHVVVNNFKVDTAASRPFEDEAVACASETAPTAADAAERERVLALQTAGNDVHPNIRSALALEVAEL